MTALRAVDLACRRSQRLVFAHLGFALGHGGAMLLTGPNGSGKSSLLRLLAGLIKPFAGRVEWQGGNVAADPAAYRDSLAYLGHQEALKPVLTASGNVRFWAALHGRDVAVDRALADMALSELAATPARFLSAGQRRRTALARVIASGAALWLLDEPTLGLDTRAIALLEAAISRHRAAGGLVIAATHAPIRMDDANILDLAAFTPTFSIEDDDAA